MKSYKIEIQLTNNQISIFRKSVGTCRYVYNLFIQENQKRYLCGEPFLNAISFTKWLNNTYIPNGPDNSWIKESSTKATRKSITNAEQAYKRFFNGQNKFPRFKKKKDKNISMYFVRSNKGHTINIKEKRIKIPILGWVKIKEFGYISLSCKIISGHISERAGKFYMAINTEETLKIKENNCNDGIGVDLGIKDFAIVSNEQIFKNINKTDKVKKIEKQLNREQRKLSRKFKNKKKGETAGQNLKSQIVRVQRLHLKLSNIRENYHNQVANTLVKTKPKYITIEHLNIRGMMKNRHLSKAISKQGFYSFIQKLKFKCIENSIELRQVDAFYPSSKMCSKCGNIKKDLKLSDRTYKCECGLVIDRDLNASLNLKQAIKYKIIT